MEEGETMRWSNEKGKKDKKYNLQYTTQKTNDRATQSLCLKMGVKSGAPEGMAVFDPHLTPVVS